jgi:hypothetical protein
VLWGQAIGDDQHLPALRGVLHYLLDESHSRLLVLIPIAARMAAS